MGKSSEVPTAVPRPPPGMSPSVTCTGLVNPPRDGDSPAALESQFPNIQPKPSQGQGFTLCPGAEPVGTEGTGTHRDTRRHVRTLRHAGTHVWHTRTLRDMQRHTGTCRDTCDTATHMTLRDKQGHSQTCRDTWGHTGTCTDTQRHSGTLRHAETYRNTQGQKCDTGTLRDTHVKHRDTWGHLGTCPPVGGRTLKTSLTACMSSGPTPSPGSIVTWNVPSALALWDCGHTGG